MIVGSHERPRAGPREHGRRPRAACGIGPADRRGRMTDSPNVRAAAGGLDPIEVNSATQRGRGQNQTNEDEDKRGLGRGLWTVRSRLMLKSRMDQPGLPKLMMCWYVSESGRSRCVNTTGDMLDERMSTVA